MASGRQHQKDSRYIGAGTALISAIGFAQGDQRRLRWDDEFKMEIVSDALWFYLGCELGAVFTPDLDMETKTLAESAPIFGTVWQIIWYPYALVMDHRSFLSHFPVVSTLIRALYFFTFCGILVTISLMAINEVAAIEAINTYLLYLTSMLRDRRFILVFTGILFSDSLHYFRDNGIILKKLRSR